ncbi:MAG: hypothetical protein KC944_02290, partial [Candidatus Omnitrophica bacterium]|nr:hypothetical protein [Candidatus Omnitrophota bacterium]
DDDHGDDDDDDDDHGRCEKDFQGAISEIDATLGTMVVRGIVVETDANTFFRGDHGETVSIDYFSVGNFVEVEGDPISEGMVLACKVKFEDGHEDECEAEFRGVVSNIDEASGTIVVGDVLLRIGSSTELLDHEKNPIALSFLAIGDVVEVKYCPRGGVPPLAERIKLEDGDDRHECEAEVEGRIEMIDLQLTALTVHGKYITATGATIRDEKNTPLEFSDLMEGDFVKVKGCLGPDSTIQAKQIILKDEDHEDCESKVRGTLTMIDLDTSTISVGIVQVQVNDQTKIEDDRTNQPLTLGDLQEGDVLKVKYCASGGIPIATKIEVKDSDDYDLDDDGEIEEHDILEMVHELSRRGVHIDLNGDNMTTSDDLILFSQRWKSRRN